MPQRGWAIPNPTHMEARTTSPLARLQQFCRTHRQTLLQTFVVALPFSSYLLSRNRANDSFSAPFRFSSICPDSLFLLPIQGKRNFQVAGVDTLLTTRNPDTRLQDPVTRPYFQTPNSRTQNSDPSTKLTPPFTPVEKERRSPKSQITVPYQTSYPQTPVSRTRNPTHPQEQERRNTEPAFLPGTPTLVPPLQL